MEINSNTKIQTTNTQSTVKTDSSNSTSFSSHLNESNSQVKLKQTTEELVADVISLLKTGLTVSELEHLQELLAKIQKLMNESSNDEMDNDTKSEIKSMISNLKNEVLALQKRMFGNVVIEPKTIDKNQDNTSDGDIDNLKQDIKSLQTSIENFNSLNSSLTEKTLLDHVIVDGIILSSQMTENIMAERRAEYKDSFTDEKFDELLSHIDIGSLSDNEKELFKSIIEDRYISDEEIKSLTYDEAKKLEKFLFVKDEYDNIIEESLINTDFKAGTLLSTTVIGDDENFKKSLYEMVQNMDKKSDIINVMVPLTGNYNFSSIAAFPDLLNINYTGKDMSEVLDSLLDDYKLKLGSFLHADEIEFYQNQISLYSELFNSFQLSLGKEETKIEETYIDDITQYLYDDLISIIKTGLTVSEVEKLEKVLNKIEILIESSKTKDVSDNEIKGMINELSKELNEIYKRLGGKGEIEVDKNLDIQNSESLTQTMKEYKSIVSGLRKAFEEMKAHYVENDSMRTDDEFKLREKLKNL